MIFGAQRGARLARVVPLLDGRKGRYTQPFPPL
jgi:hypothetical protein